MTKLEAILIAVCALGLSLALVMHHIDSGTIKEQTAIAAQAIQKAQEDEAKAVAAYQERDAAKAQADAFRGQAEAALAQSHAKDVTLAKLQAQIAAMGAQAPVVAPDTLPQDPKLLAAAFTKEGFQPSLVGKMMGWPVETARPMLGLIQDGKQYPSALARIDAMGQENTILLGQKADLTTAVVEQTKRGDALDTALVASKQGEAASKDETVQLKVAIGAKDKIISAEKRGKVTWGAVGAAAGWLVRTFVLHWPF